MNNRDISLYLVLIFSSSITFYLSKISIYSPVYIIYLTVLPISLTYLLFRLGEIKISKDLIIIEILFIYILILVIFVHRESLFTGAFINLFLGLFAYIYIRLSKKHIKYKYYYTIIKIMIYIAIICIVADTGYRLMRPNYSIRTSYLESRWFYYYKKNSIMFSDSNSTALVILILYFTIIELKRLNTDFIFKNERYIKIILIGLLLLTFSRAAYIALIAGLVYKKYHGKNKTSKTKNIIIISIIIVIALIIIYNLYKTDLSFKSKFYIIEIAINAFKKFDMITKLTGIGFLEWQDILGIYTHNIFITYFIQTGIIGLLLYIIFIAIIYKKTKYLLFPIIIVSLSFFSYLGTPFLFVPLALICNLYDMKREKGAIK